ncbi:MAG: hypothetical protein KDA84_10455, partial [Planctomycetaceae bacterium]|nr:hypothetical protein [Planctomycetaceae bacterium]
MATSAHHGSTILSRMTPALRLRVGFLAAGNLLLVGYLFVYTLLTPNTSFGTEVSQFPSGAAPLLLAGIGLTGIVYAGAIDLSIGSIIVMCGTVFGILLERQSSPLVCFLSCCLVAVVLSSFNGVLVRWSGIP